LFHRQHKAVQPGLIFNSLEFGGIKIGVVDLFPYSQKLDGVLIPEPFFNQGKTVVDVPYNIGQ
jgi:hypothetical protein